MSEINLNEVLNEEMDDAQAITVPIDETLTHSGEAADAAAVGAALAEKADKSELQTKVKVNNQEADDQGLILLLAKHIPMAETEGAESVGEALTRVDGKTAADIKMGPEQGAKSIRQEILEAVKGTAETIAMGEEDPTTIAEAMAEKVGKDDIDAGLTESGKVADAKAAGDAIEALGTSMAQALGTAVERLQDQLDGKISGIRTMDTVLEPDEDGIVALDEVEYAQQLKSSRNEETTGEFITRTTSGSGSISDGSATLGILRGNLRRDGYVPETLDMAVIAIPRPAPEGLTATLDAAVFKAYVGAAGTWTLSWSAAGGAWSADPATFGVTVSGEPADGDTITLTWDGDAASDPEMTVYAPRVAPEEITAVLDKAVFREEVTESAVINLYFTTAWSEDPGIYGVTVSGTPVAGDQIRITYVKENRGTITTARPTRLVATGWNLYSPAHPSIHAPKYSDTWGYRIDGTWMLIEWSETENGARQTISTSGSLFQVPGDGWIHISGGDETTALYTTWSDWTGGYAGEFKAYEESAVDLSGAMANFPGGLCRIGEIFDEINNITKKAVSRIERIAFSAAALETVIASGRAYIYDESWIYAERETEVSYDIALEGGYEANEHGLEILEGTELACTVTALYGPNLKDKLERDVLTLSRQELTAEQRAQVQSNLNVPDASAVALLRDSMTYVVDGHKSVRAIPAGAYFQLINSQVTGRIDGAYTAAQAIPANTAIDSSYFGQTAPLAAGALNDAFSSLSSKIKTISISGTTDNTGDIALNMNVSDIIPLAIYGQGTKGYIFMCSSDSFKWWVKFINDNLSNAANESISFTLIYRKRQ